MTAPFQVGDEVEIWHATHVPQGTKGVVQHIYETTCVVLGVSGMSFSVSISAVFKRNRPRIHCCVKCGFPNNYQDAPFICMKCQMERQMYE